MLARLANSLKYIAGRWSKRELVGIDSVGNKYFREPKAIDGAVTERRWVEFNGHEDPTTVPVEWSSWLSRTRTAAPTPEEIEGMELNRKLIKYKAAVLEQEEEKRRFQAKSMQHGISAEDVSPEGMERMMKQISADHGGDNVKGGQGHTNIKTQGTRAEDDTSSSSQQPDFGLAEPSGRGDSFKPGSWQPPQGDHR